MRFLSKEEFEAAIQKYGLKPTPLRVDDHKIWKTPQGHAVSIPDLDEPYPDTLLADVWDRIRKLDEVDR